MIGAVLEDLQSPRFHHGRRPAPDMFSILALAVREERSLEKSADRRALHFAHYNLVRVHKSLRVTPAMAAGVENPLWSLEELVEQTTA